MPEQQDMPSQQADPLRLDRCPDCGYMLTGLPGQGICPECGFAYRPEMIVLYGWGRADVSHARGWRLVALVLLNCGWLVQLILPIILGLWFGYSWEYLWAVAFLAFITWVSFRRWRRNRQDSPAPVQLRLCPVGYAQRDGVGRVRLHAWTSNSGIELRQSGGRSYRIFRHLPFWSWPWPQIDMEFDCDPATAQRVEEQIRHWQGQAAK